MKIRIVLTFGILSGVVSATMMFATLPFIEEIGFDRGAIVGYTAIVLSFLFVYFGVRAYRQRLEGAPLTFGAAFGVGILITLISCVFYVAAWEVIQANFMPDFVDKYTTQVIDQLRASGATPAAIDAKMRELAHFKTMYARFPVRAAFTFIEPFPVGLLITVISAWVLRRK